MFKKKLPQWSMLPAEVEVTHFYGMTSEGLNYFWFTLEFQEVGKQTSEQLTFC